VLINGKLLPYSKCTPQVPFRLLNASNGGSIFSLSTTRAVPADRTDQGLLPAPAAVSSSPSHPASAPTSWWISRNIRPAHSAQEFSIHAHAVSRGRGTSGGPSALPPTLRPVAKIAETSGDTHQKNSRSRNWIFGGRTHDPPADGKRWHDLYRRNPCLAQPDLEFLNLTDDSHPIHLHLVRFQILDRRPIDVSAYLYDNKLRYTADARRPIRTKPAGKTTVRVSPGASTRIIVKFEGYTGRYVWHCTSWSTRIMK